eukprot:COSAG01_NODE_486_length_16379_cov_28.208717_14_plen_265_part_00
MSSDSDEAIEDGDDQVIGDGEEQDGDDPPPAEFGSADTAEGAGGGGSNPLRLSVSSVQSGPDARMCGERGSNSQPAPRARIGSAPSTPSTGGEGSRGGEEGTYVDGPLTREEWQIAQKLLDDLACRNVDGLKNEYERRATLAIRKIRRLGYRAELELLGSLTHKVFEQGVEIIREGDPGKCFFILTEGSCDVRRRRRRRRPRTLLHLRRRRRSAVQQAPGGVNSVCCGVGGRCWDDAPPLGCQVGGVVALIADLTGTRVMSCGR